MDIHSGIRLYEETLMDTKGHEALRWNEGKSRDEAKRSAGERLAVAIVRYAVTDILGWEPDFAYRHMTTAIGDRLLLDRVSGMLDRPKGVSAKDYKWLITYAFPREVKVDIRQDTIQTYKDVLSGKIKRFPRYYFDGGDAYGPYRLSTVLMYHISSNYAVRDVSELYSLFGGPKASDILRRGRLMRVCSEYFRTPLDYLHASLAPSQRDDFYYRYYKFQEFFALV